MGQYFAKAFEINFQDQDKQLQTAWTTSWGVSTRLIGGLIMCHSDDDGLVLPPKLAPHQVVIIPVVRKNQDAQALYAACDELAAEISKAQYANNSVRVHVDKRDMRGGDKMWSWVKKGVPIRIEIGGRELEEQAFSFVERHDEAKQKISSSFASFPKEVEQRLVSIQEALFKRAKQRMLSHCHVVESPQALNDLFDGGPGGFAVVGWCEPDGIEAQLKNDHAVTVRCVLDIEDAQSLLGPLALPSNPECIWTQKPCNKIAVLAKSY